jgi:hypothetical protein
MSVVVPSIRHSLQVRSLKYLTYYKVEGEVYVCGNGERGQLGQGTITKKEYKPLKIEFKDEKGKSYALTPKFKQVTCGYFHTGFLTGMIISVIHQYRIWCNICDWRQHRRLARYSSCIEQRHGSISGHFRLSRWSLTFTGQKTGFRRVFLCSYFQRGHLHMGCELNYRA